MKKLFSMFLAVTFALTMVGIVFAADNAAKAAAPAAAPAEKKKAPPAGEKKASKATSHLVTGKIVELDAAAGTFTVMVKRRDVPLKAGKNVKLAGFKVDDMVTVKYSDGTASSVKAEKSKPEKSAKKAKAAPAPVAAPVPAAAPVAPAEKK